MKTECTQQSTLFDYRLNRTELLEVANKYRQSYADAKPYPHVVLDEIFPDHVLDAIIREYPSPSEIDWITYDSDYQFKLASHFVEQFGSNTRFFMHLLMSPVFVEFLETLTGIGNLTSDPMFGGGGLHRVLRGGYLNIHADFNRHPRTQLDRRLNVLLYLNKDWPEEYGGHLELWDREMTTAVKRILPLHNRLIIFSTDSYSYHGHPEPLQCPEGVSRRSIALYYYSNGRPEQECDSAPASHSTLYQKRPSDRTRLKRLISCIAPPIFVNFSRNLRMVLFGRSKSGRVNALKNIIVPVLPPIVCDIIKKACNIRSD